MLAVVLLAASALAGPTPAAGVDRHVDPQGRDAGNECAAVAEPCRTITHALSRASPGDRVLVAAGVFGDGETFPIEVPAGVVLLAPGGRDATTLVDARTSPADPRTLTMTIVDAAAPPLGIEGFTIDGGGLAGHEFGIFVESFAAPAPPAAPLPFVRGCRLRGFSGSAITLVTWGCCDPTPLTRLAALVERNEVVGSGTGSGISVLTVADDLVTRALDESWLRNNIIRGCATGIQVAALVGAPDVPLGNGSLRTVLRHNTVVDSVLDGVWLSSEEADSQVSLSAVSVEIGNNLLAANGGHGVREDAGDGTERFRRADASRLTANLLFGNRLGGYFDLDTERVYSSASELGAIPDVAGVSGANLADDPALEPDLGRLSAASPAIDAGDPDRSAPDDFDGEPRPAGAAPDIGADEVILLRRGAFRDLDPLTPPKPDLFARLPGYVVATASPLIDPDSGVLGDATRPLVVYTLGGAGVTLRLVKEPVRNSVRLEY